MGGGSFSSSAFRTYSTTRGYDRAKNAQQIYKASGLDPEFDPRNFRYRESVDGPDNPESTPVIIGLDVTGSMGPVLLAMAKEGLRDACQGIYDGKPISNPHICTLGIGDVEYDRAPFQATQFEADIRIFEQLERLFLEKGGGGNSYESYILAWYFAKYRTVTDSFKKRGRKGFIFTLGDEQCTPGIPQYAFDKFFGDSKQGYMSAEQLFQEASAEWDIYHMVIKQGSHIGGLSSRYEIVRKSWSAVIGEQRVIGLNDYAQAGKKMVEVMSKEAATFTGTYSAPVVGGNPIRPINPFED